MMTEEDRNILSYQRSLCADVVDSQWAYRDVEQDYRNAQRASVAECVSRLRWLNGEMA